MVHVAAAEGEEEKHEAADGYTDDGGEGQDEAIGGLGVEIVGVDCLDGVLCEDGLVEAEEVAGGRTLIAADGEGDEDFLEYQLKSTLALEEEERGR